MNPAAMQFLRQNPGALPLYETLENRVLSEIQNVTVNVQRTQISFGNDHTFACVSFAKPGRAMECADPYIVLTFFLGKKLCSSRVKVGQEPHLNHWTHHTTVFQPAEIDAELMGWLKDASSFTAEKPEDGGFFA